jgi:hypothetical protein
MRDMLRVDGSILRDVDLYWDVTTSIDTAVLVKEAVTSEGNDGYEWIG